MIRIRALLAAALVAAPIATSSGTLVASAQTPAQVKAAHDATREARDVTYGLYNGRSRFGTVTLRPIGRTRSRITIQLANPANGANLSLVPGSYCTSNRGTAAVAAIPLSNATSSSQVSQTIVNLPITQLNGGNYAVRVRNATQQRSLAETCAQFRR